MCTPHWDEVSSRLYHLFLRGNGGSMITLTGMPDCERPDEGCASLQPGHDESAFLCRRNATEAVVDILISHFGRGLNRQHDLHGGHERAFTKMLYAAQACEASRTNIVPPMQIALQSPSLEAAARNALHALRGCAAMLSTVCMHACIARLQLDSQCLTLKGIVAVWWGL